MTNLQIHIDIRQQLRDALIIEYGEIWLRYCEEMGLGDDIRLGYLDYLNKVIDGV